jgi:hypothetical protein
MQLNFFASPAELAPPIKTRNRRKSVQDSKEQLIEQIRASCARPPAWLGSAGIMATRAWVECAAKQMKVAKSERASVPALKAALNSITAASQKPE